MGKLVEQLKSASQINKERRKKLLIRGSIFPPEVYVQESPELDGELEAYRDFEGTEEDDTVAVYRLTGVYRVKKEVKRVLVEERGEGKGRKGEKE